MASLSSGVLLKLLHDMNMPSTAFHDEASSTEARGARDTVLQVTGIAPALADLDLLSSEQGFYLKVSDASHSTYVSLPPDLNDLVLSDVLQLGQFIHVDRLRPGSPVPALDGLTLLPGRHPCLHSTTNIVAATPAVSSGSSSGLFPSAAMPPVPPPEKKKRHQRSMSNSKMEHLRSSSSRSSSRSSSKSGIRSPYVPTSPANGSWELERSMSDVLSELKKTSMTCAYDESYDSDESKFSFTSSSSSYSSPSFVSRSRKSWDAKGALKGRRDMNPPVRSRSASVSPVRMGSLVPKDDDTLDSMLISKRNAERAYSVLSSNPKRKLSISACACSPSSCQERSRVIWASLSSNLMKHGKDILRQRDLALQAAVEALLEASASERLIKCLSMYSELQSEKDSDPQQLVDKFLNLHQDLAYTKLITHTLPKLSLSRTCSCNSASLVSIKSLNEIAFERKACASSWIKAALESDLQKFPNQLRTAESTEFRATNEKPLSSVAYSHRPKTVFPKGSSSLLVASNELQQECNRWFLRFLDKFLHSVQSEIHYMEHESQVVNLLCQLKRVDDWLNKITSNRNKESILTDDEESEACERVRRKIYSILLRHVESAAFALESMSTMVEEKQQCL